MSRFYVGQRVRILWSLTWPELDGNTGVIFAPASHGKTPDGVPMEYAGDWLVVPDAWPDGYCPTEATKGGGRMWFCPDSEQLTPAYDGNEKVSWESCLWQPSPERVA